MDRSKRKPARPATTAVARDQNVSHPNIQPIFGLARREAHWYEDPLSAMRHANWATTSATRVCPTAAMTHSQIPTCPAVASSSPYVAKTPTATEMNPNEIANT